MKSRKLSRKRSRATIISAAAASVVAGVALLPNWSAGAAVTDDPTVDTATKATFQRLADAVFTDRTQALVRRCGAAVQAADLRFLRRCAHVRHAVAPGGLRAQPAARPQGAVWPRWASSTARASTSVKLDATQVKGRRATVAVTETTSLTYKKVTGSQPPTTGFQAHHELTFQADRGGDWQLTRIRDTDEGYLAVNQVAKPEVAKVTVKADDGPPEAPRAATTRPAPANPKNLTASGYDYKAMVAYATKYWSKYNTEYPDFNGAGAGGDCTNFVSQSLKAGGWSTFPVTRTTSTSGSATPTSSRTPSSA